MEIYSYVEKIPKKFIHDWIKLYDGEKVCLELEGYSLDTKLKMLVELYYLYDNLEQERIVLNKHERTNTIIFNFIDYRGVTVYRILSNYPVVAYLRDGHRKEKLSYTDFTIRKCFIPPKIEYQHYLDYHKTKMLFLRHHFFIVEKETKNYGGNYGLIYSDNNMSFEVPIAKLIFEYKYEYLDICHMEISEDLIINYQANVETYLQFNKYMDYSIEGRIDIINWKSIDYNEKKSLYS